MTPKKQKPERTGLLGAMLPVWRKLAEAARRTRVVVSLGPSRRGQRRGKQRGPTHVVDAGEYRERLRQRVREHDGIGSRKVAAKLGVSWRTVVAIRRAA